MKRFTFFLLLIPLFSSAQLRNNIWCFGDSAGMNFNFDPPINFTSFCNTRGSSTSISDSSGNLLLYTAETPWGTFSKRTRVFNSQNQIVQNGDSIVGLGWYREHVLVPFPNHSNIFYLFSVGVTDDYGLYYSVIDISQNGGLGAVVQKNVQLLSYEVTDGLQAIKHGNGRDWWIICRRCGITTNEHDLFLLSANGISGPYIQQVGSPSFYNTTRLDFSPNGDKLSEVNFAGLLEVFDFDRCTGILSNAYSINQENNPWIQFVCSEFSPDENLLYVSVNDYTSYLLQLNLLDPQPWQTHDTLWALSSTHDSGGLLELAPNGKIYYSCDWYDGTHFNYPYPDSAYYLENMNLGVIDSPNVVGVGSNYQPYGFYLGGNRTYIGLPNNPNYELPALGGSICDTLATLAAEELQTPEKADLNIFYHPEWQTAFINVSGIKEKTYVLRLVNLEGKELVVETGNLNSSFFTKDLSCAKLSPGIYFVLFETEKDRLVKKFLLEK